MPSVTFDLADPETSRVRHPATEETAAVVVHPVRSRSPQRVLAVRHDPLDPRRRRPRRDRELHRRPQPLLHRLRRGAGHESDRRRRDLHHRDRTSRHTRIGAHRQRLHLHRQTSRRESRHGNPHRSARRHLQTLEPVSPANLRESRTLPPDRQEVPRQTTRRRHRSPSSKPNSTGSSTTTTNNDRTARSAAAPPPKRSTPDSKPTRPTSIPPPTSGSVTTKSTNTDRSPSATKAKLHHIGMGARHRGQPVVMLIADRDIRIVTPDGEPLRHLTLDPPATTSPKTTLMSTMTRHMRLR